MSLEPTYLPLAISVAVKAMREFCQQWYSGLQLCLSLEISADGEIPVCSRVIAGDVATTHTQPRDALYRNLANFFYIFQIVVNLWKIIKWLLAPSKKGCLFSVRCLVEVNQAIISLAKLILDKFKNGVEVPPTIATCKEEEMLEKLQLLSRWCQVCPWQRLIILLPNSRPFPSP